MHGIFLSGAFSKGDCWRAGVRLLAEQGCAVTAQARETLAHLSHPPPDRLIRPLRMATLTGIEEVGAGCNQNRRVEAIELLSDLIRHSRRSRAFAPSRSLIFRTTFAGSAMLRKCMENSCNCSPSRTFSFLRAIAAAGGLIVVAVVFLMQLFQLLQLRLLLPMLLFRWCFSWWPCYSVRGCCCC